MRFGQGMAGANQRRGNDAFTKLLLHFDGANGSTAIVDSSANARTATIFGDTQISTAQSVFGGSSGLFDGTGDYLTFADHADFDFGNGDFTIEFRLRPATVAGVTTIISKRNLGTNSQPFHIIINAGVLQFYCSSNGTSLDIANAVSMGSISAGSWQKFAISRAGSAWRTFKDGVQVSSFTSSAAVVANSSVVYVGAQNNGGNLYNGHMDEVRVSKGIARWTADYTPPVRAY